MVKLFSKQFKKIINELKKKDTIPSSEVERKILLSGLAGIAEDFGNVLFDNKQETLNYHRAKTIREIQGKAKKILVVKIEDIEFFEFSPEILKLIKDKTFVASQSTLARMIDNVMLNLADSYTDGLGIKEAADSLDDVFASMLDYELKRVARTEINGAQNQATFLTEQDLGVDFHQWWTAQDDRVRGLDPVDMADHTYLHGQIVRVGVRFSNGLMHPLDTSGDIAEWINCRCRAVPFLMPEGYQAPGGLDFFYEEDLVKIGVLL